MDLKSPHRYEKTFCFSILHSLSRLLLFTLPFIAPPPPPPPSQSTATPPSKLNTRGNEETQRTHKQLNTRHRHAELTFEEICFVEERLKESTDMMVKFPGRNS
ncbi:hypothetical protein Droror1_Dr00006201 [Drosera rotundifolia]